MTIDVTECPNCQEKGRYEGRVLIGGRGFYACSNGHKWQDMAEKPSNKGVEVRLDQPMKPEKETK